MNELEKELLDNKIVNLQAVKDKNFNKKLVHIDNNKLLQFPHLFRQIVDQIWNRIKTKNIKKIVVGDSLSMLLGVGLISMNNLIVERLKDCREFNNSILLIGKLKNYEDVLKNSKKFSQVIVVFDTTDRIHSVKEKLDILFFPKKKNKKTCLVLNWKNFRDIEKVIEYYGNKLQIVKIYAASVDFFSYKKLVQLSKKYEFLIWEGTIFSCDLNIFFYQITGKFNFHKWVDMIEVEQNADNYLGYTKILKALSSKTCINVHNELEINYFYKKDYFDKKFLDVL